MSVVPVSLERTRQRTSLIEGFRLARYCVEIEGEELELAVGHLAQQLELRLPKAHTFAYVTAHNAELTERSEQDNDRADALLRSAIDRLGYPRWPMSSIAANGGWWESGWLVADASRVKLDDWARRFGQAGTLAWRRGEPVRLRMYTQRPAFDQHDDVDWIVLD